MFFIDKCPNPMGVDIAHFEKKLTLTIHHWPCHGFGKLYWNNRLSCLCSFLGQFFVADCPITYEAAALPSVSKAGFLWMLSRLACASWMMTTDASLSFKYTHLFAVWYLEMSMYDLHKNFMQ
jgi:hypothetical protein